MANNFRIAGGAYASKAGSDANNGLSPDTPKATLGALALLAANVKVVGSGFYQEASDFNANRTWYADGLVVVNGNGGAFNPGYNQFFYGFRFENFNTGGGLNQPVQFFDCVFSNITRYGNAAGAGHGETFTRCIFINCDMSQFTGTLTFNECILINSSATKVVALRSCYTNAATNIYFAAGTGQANSSHSNIMGGLAFVEAGTGTIGIIQDKTGNYYNLALAGTGGTGTEADPFYRANTAGKLFDLAAHRQAYPASFANSFNLPPLFNNAAKEDFSLQYNSPHIGKGLNTGSNIGATSYARSYYASLSPEWLPENGAVYAGLELSGQDIVISAGQSAGSVTTAPIRIAINPQTIEKIEFLGALLFNKSAAGGSATNKNVPDANVYASADATGAGNPDRLTIEMRFTPEEPVPTVDTEWTNGGYMPAGSFGKFLINAKPFIDNAGKGNGEPDFNTISNQPVFAVWVQCRVTLTNNYLPA